MSFVYFSAKDVVRHPVVAEIIKAYETDELKEAAQSVAETDES